MTQASSAPAPYGAHVAGADDASTVTAATLLFDEGVKLMDSKRSARPKPQT